MPLSVRIGNLHWFNASDRFIISGNFPFSIFRYNLDIHSPAHFANFPRTCIVRAGCTASKTKCHSRLLFMNRHSCYCTHGDRRVLSLVEYMYNGRCIELSMVYTSQYVSLGCVLFNWAKAIFKILHMPFRTLNSHPLRKHADSTTRYWAEGQTPRCSWITNNNNTPSCWRVSGIS